MSETPAPTDPSDASPAPSVPSASGQAPGRPPAAGKAAAGKAREAGTAPAPPTRARGSVSRRDKRLFALCLLSTAAAGVAGHLPLGSIVPFLIAAIALALLASLVGRAVDALGDRLGAGATGVVQSALGNLPELFVCLFALHDGLLDVVRAALVGSVLANVLLVLGMAFVVGGLRHGTQRFAAERARLISLMLVLSVMALLLPSLAHVLHTPADHHAWGLSIVTSVLLLVLFALSLPAAMAREPGAKTSPATGETTHGPATGETSDGPSTGETSEDGSPATTEDGDEGSATRSDREWPLALALTVLTLAGVGAALVSDWFVAALQPAIEAAGISQAFAGLVVVAIAGNAVENVVGIQLAARNQADYALSVILQSPLQITLVVAPVLVLAAPLVGATFTLVLSPFLVATLLVAALVAVIVVVDGESTWFEGAALLVLYLLVATAFWWG